MLQYPQHIFYTYGFVDVFCKGLDLRGIHGHGRIQALVGHALHLLRRGLVVREKTVNFGRQQIDLLQLAL